MLFDYNAAAPAPIESCLSATAGRRLWEVWSRYMNYFVLLLDPTLHGHLICFLEQKLKFYSNVCTIDTSSRKKTMFGQSFTSVTWLCRSYLLRFTRTSKPIRHPSGKAEM